MRPLNLHGHGMTRVLPNKSKINKSNQPELWIPSPLLKQDSLMLARDLFQSNVSKFCLCHWTLKQNSFKSSFNLETRFFYFQSSSWACLHCRLEVGILMIPDQSGEIWYLSWVGQNSTQLKGVSCGTAQLNSCFSSPAQLNSLFSSQLNSLFPSPTQLKSREEI